MKHGVYPYRGISPGIGEFDESRCVGALYDDTRLDSILRRFRVTGVLPDCGRSALPADIVFGDYDFGTLRAALDEARAAGVDETKIEEFIHGNLNRDANPADSEHGAESGVESPAHEPGQTVAADGGQGGSPAN